MWGTVRKRRAHGSRQGFAGLAPQSRGFGAVCFQRRFVRPAGWGYRRGGMHRAFFAPWFCRRTAMRRGSCVAPRFAPCRRFVSRCAPRRAPRCFAPRRELPWLRYAHCPRPPPSSRTRWRKGVPPRTSPRATHPHGLWESHCSRRSPATPKARSVRRDWSALTRYRFAVFAGRFSRFQIP